MNPLAPEYLPVIIGIGEITDRTRDPLHALEPIDLMAQSLRHAATDACPSAAGALLAGIDSLDIVAEHSWPYTDPCTLLSERLSIHPARAVYGVTGGESPVRFMHEAALRISRGETAIAAVVGGEATYSVSAATKAGLQPPWSRPDPAARLVRGSDLCNPLAAQHGVTQPVQVYPFYENAAAAAWGQTPAEALQESGEIWSRFSAVAAANPFAWLARRYAPAEITTPTADNRLIAWPYTKHMVANPLVNQGAAVILTSLAKALELGIAEQQLVHVCAGACAKEPTDYLLRQHYRHSACQEAVLRTVLEHAGGDVSRFAMVELYSCFPIVPKMARRTLGMAADAPMTTTGGLSFFGAPLNNYMTHAAAGMVRGLRQHRGKLALLYGQGEFLTKHHALLLASAPPATNQLQPEYSVQHLADREPGRIPQLLLDYAGPASIETFTVVYARDGAATYGTVIARVGDARLMARVPAEDAASLAVLTNLSTSPVSRIGTVSRGPDGLLIWTIA
jgi:acetyl-CoA C-acetyltransferase